MKRLIVPLAMMLSASPALAHLDPAEHGSLMAGFSHPMFGADHLLAMVAVGLLAVTMAGRAVVALPLAFMTGMAAGFGLALAGLTLPLVEPMILASVMVIGGLTALAVRLPLGAVAALVATFGAFHGFAHGGEIGIAGEVPFGIGFLIGTGLLHTAGIVLASALLRGFKATRGGAAIRFLGVLTAIGGAGLAFG